MCKRVLWIEDQSTSKLLILAGPVNFHYAISMDYCTTITEAIEMMRSEEYDLVIIDIRNLPGRNKDWHDLYKRYNCDIKSAKLGLKLLQAIFYKEKAEIKIADFPPSWLNQDKICVFTVEDWNNIGRELSACKITKYYSKVAESSRMILLNIIKKELNIE